ncbi:MAG: DivIVA domain-containing protein, partial [Nocardioides sp.]
MPLTPEDVSNKRFTPVRLREGYDMGEVDQFLDEVEAELARLTKENDDLRSK